MNLPANQVKTGMAVMYKEKLYRVASLHHHTPGNLRAQVHVKLHPVGGEGYMEFRWRADETIEIADLETREMEYLYASEGMHTFMDTTNYEMITMTAEFLEHELTYLQPNMKVFVEFHEGRPIGVELPMTVELTITDTEPALKGATASGSLKPATCDNGLLIKVPNYMQIGDRVKVDTRDDSFIERI